MFVLKQPRTQHLVLIMKNLAQNGRAFEQIFEKKNKRFFQITTVFVSFIQSNSELYKYVRRMNIKKNILFCVKNTISKVKSIKQGYHYNKWHHEKPKQLSN